MSPQLQGQAGRRTSFCRTDSAARSLLCGPPRKVGGLAFLPGDRKPPRDAHGLLPESLIDEVSGPRWPSHNPPLPAVTSGDPVPVWDAVAQSDLSWERCLPSWGGFGLDTPPPRSQSPQLPAPRSSKWLPRSPPLGEGRRPGAGAPTGAGSPLRRAEARVRQAHARSLLHPAPAHAPPAGVTPTQVNLSLVPRSRSLSPSLRLGLPEDRHSPEASTGLRPAAPHRHPKARRRFLVLIKS